MNRTVSQLIRFGFLVVLVLLGVVAAIGVWTLSTTSHNYERALAASAGCCRRR